MNELEQFVNNVEQMRVAQKNYFARIATAKKSKLPADFAAASNALNISKHLESKVDAQLLSIQKSGSINLGNTLDLSITQ
jgi:hypothetical protein